MLSGLWAASAWLAGCGERRPVVDRRLPPPSQPAPTPPDVAENAKRSTEPGPSKPARPAAKPGRPAGAPAPEGYTEEGVASWYGVPFHGRRASNGEVYDMYKLTAAHRTLPFDTVVRVTNLNNGKSTTVRITDRGPFVDNRVIDLSYAAAREIESVGTGIAPVRLELVSGGDPLSGFFTVQVGAFKERANAQKLKERLSASYSPIYIQPFDSPEGTFYRVRVGRVAGEVPASQFGEQLRAKENFTPLVVRLDENAGTGEN